MAERTLLATAYRVDRAKWIVDGEVREWKGHDTSSSLATAMATAEVLAESDGPGHPVRVVEIQYTQVWRSDDAEET